MLPKSLAVDDVFGDAKTWLDLTSHYAVKMQMNKALWNDVRGIFKHKIKLESAYKHCLSFGFATFQYLIN